MTNNKFDNFQLQKKAYKFFYQKIKKIKNLTVKIKPPYTYVKRPNTNFSEGERRERVANGNHNHLSNFVDYRTLKLLSDKLVKLISKFSRGKNYSCAYKFKTVEISGVPGGISQMLTCQTILSQFLK